MRAYLEISAETEKAEIVIKELKKLKEVEQVSSTSEEFNIIATVEVKDYPHLHQVLTKISATEGVKASKPVLVPM